MIELLIAGAAAIVTHIKVRGFVHGRLRFVDRAHRPTAPVIAGAAATAIAAPVVWVLPVVGAVTAVALGIGVATGVARGSRDVRMIH